MIRLLCLVLLMSTSVGATPILTVPTRLDPLVQSADMIDPQWRLEPAVGDWPAPAPVVPVTAPVDPVTPIPEPTSLLLVGSGLGLLARKLRRHPTYISVGGTPHVHQKTSEVGIHRGFHSADPV